MFLTQLKLTVVLYITILFQKIIKCFIALKKIVYTIYCVKNYKFRKKVHCICKKNEKYMWKTKRQRFFHSSKNGLLINL